jgi:hypothetical protein
VIHKEVARIVVGPVTVIEVASKDYKIDAFILCELYQRSEGFPRSSSEILYGCSLIGVEPSQGTVEMNVRSM